MIAWNAAKICQPCVSNAVAQFARAYHVRTDIYREPRALEGIGEFIADHPAPLMAG